MNRMALQIAPWLVILAAAACGSSANDGASSGDGGGATSADAGVPQFGTGDASGGPESGVVTPTGPVTDFPAPILESGAPSNAPALFGPPSQGAPSGGPCLVEPETDVLYPQNWLRPRFSWRAANGENLFELRLHVANQLSDLVVYTTSTQWTMPKPLWDALRTHSPTEAMTLTIRGGVLAGGALQGEATGTVTPMGVAPVQASGAIVYWTTNDSATGASALKGFSPGDESVETVLAPSQVASSTSQCIGCHTSTPDGEFAAVTTTTAQQGAWTDALARIDPSAGAVGGAAPYVSSAGAAALARKNVGAATFSPAHWAPGDRKAVVSYDNDGSATNVVLSWIDLEASDAAHASGTLARNGDTGLAGAPAFRHDGASVVYTSTNRVCTGRLGNCTPQYQNPSDPGSRADLFTVPFAGGAGGTATPLAGASDPNVQEYYPSYSPDDRFVVFNRVPNDANLYDQPASEIFVVPSSGGAPVRLAANDPPACTGKKSPGVTNSWGKWGPQAQEAFGKTYYWIVFSSKRDDAGSPQLYLASAVLGPDGALTTHGAIYLWNQPAKEANHTPAWDVFKVPPIPAPK